MSRSQTPAERAASAKLLSLASHELRTPVSVVSGYLRMLQRDATLNERQRKMIDEADKACMRLAAIIGEISEVGKLDDGRMTLQSESLDLFALMRELAPSIDEAADRGVTLELYGCDSRGLMRGDRAHLKTAFTSIIRAVLREQPENAVVHVQCQGLGNSVDIAVGRPETIAQHHAGPQAAFDEQRGGLGLALPIARRVIDGHGGRIWSPAGADGTAAARTAVFITLPLS